GRDDRIEPGPVGSARDGRLPRHRAGPGRVPRGQVDAVGPARRQRVRRPPPARPDEGGPLMSPTVLSTRVAWWDLVPAGAVRVDTTATTTGELLADRAAIEAAASGEPVDPQTLDPVSPVTAPCRVVAQMTNYRSHVADAGMDPDTVPLTFFRKSSASI